MKGSQSGLKTSPLVSRQIRKLCGQIVLHWQWLGVKRYRPVRGIDLPRVAMDYSPGTGGHPGNEVKKVLPMYFR